MNADKSQVKPGARTALALLLSINLFNYIDRQVLAAVEPEIRDTFFAPNDPNAMATTGLLGTAFLVTYMVAAPALGWLADRFSRWIIVGCAVLLWSLASGGSGLAATFGILLATRVCVGIGEGGYGPAAPTILADLYPLAKRGRVLAIFCAAIPVGSALGYVLGGVVAAHLNWRWAFYLVTPPGILLGAFCFWQRDPRTLDGARPPDARAPGRRSGPGSRTPGCGRRDASVRPGDIRPPGTRAARPAPPRAPKPAGPVPIAGIPASRYPALA